jgi:hydroxypyruvate isomerase
MLRRDALSALAGLTLASHAASCASDSSPEAEAGTAPRDTGFRQSVCYWPFADVPLDEFCGAVKQLGLTAVDLLHSEQWEVAARHGLVCSMGNTSRRPDYLTRGLCDRSIHDVMVGEVETALPVAVEAGVPNLIVLFGNREGRSDEEGIANAVACFERMKPSAEDAGVTLCVEMLNSKVDHKDYQGDTTAFGVAVAEAVDSPRVKLLYDIYHMQVMEGDVIRTIRDHHRHIAHYHTAGNPGRHELDDRQELQYGAIARAITETGFTGYLAHEFIPAGDWKAGLRQAMQVCSS